MSQTSPSKFVHPGTGEVLVTEQDFKKAMAYQEDRLSYVYGLLWPLREEYAERFPPAPLPRARDRSPTQEKVARCPRCGGVVPESEEGPVHPMKGGSDEDPQSI